METVKCLCGGNPLVEFHGDIVRIICDDCKKYVATVPERGETEREQLKRTVKLWNDRQRGGVNAPLSVYT